MDSVDINNLQSAFEELNKINEEDDLAEASHTYNNYWTDPDYQILESTAPWWFVSRCYYQHISSNETRFQAAPDKSREAAYRRAESNNQVKSILVKILYNAARRPNAIDNTRNKGGISGQEILKMAYECLLALI